ncbi:hypothetical protein TrVFT333_011556 [Trichoderma virens FT-333]|nr:hypothetical protein TrVFT333_011556 [Trichoderma virens FT-333]
MTDAGHSEDLYHKYQKAEELYKNGKYEEAEKLFRETAEGRKTTLGVNNPDTLWSKHHLAESLYHQGKYEEAENVFREAAEGRKISLGVNNPDTLWSKHRRAESLYRQGKYNEAETIFRETAEGRKDGLGVHNPDTLWSKHYLAESLYHQGKYEEAETIFRETAEGRKISLGANNPDTLWSKHRLAESLYHQEKYNEAETIFRETAEGRKVTLGADDSNTLWSKHYLAESLYHQGKYGEAEKVFRETADGREKTLGADHSDTLWSRMGLEKTLKQLPGIQPATIELFDDMNEYNEEYLNMFHNSCQWYAKQLGNSASRSVPPVRIAVLDTGINKTHGGIQGGFASKLLDKNRCHSWVGDPHNVHDNDGHGTNITNLLLRVAPWAEICVAKVFNKNTFNVEEASNVAKAISYAVKQWNVDIITMSFGLKLPALEDKNLIKAFQDIEDALSNARTKIIFAAAANHGSHGPRSFPAVCRDVICIHASDGKGKDGGISPLAVDNDENFMTLGTGILTTDAQGRQILKSGTSYAAPIAAAIAANVLYVTQTMMSLTPVAQKRLRTGDGMRKMLELMSIKGPDGYRFLAPWTQFWREGWHCRPDEMEYIRQSILRLFPY